MNEPLDPTQSTDPRLRRGAFVALSALGAAGAAATIDAMAQSLGHTHPPLVAPDDPAIRVERVRLDRPGGAIDAYAAWPKDARANGPAIVVTMHIWGVDTSIRDVVRRLAKAGFAAIAPDLYARAHAPSGDGISDIDVFRPFAKGLNDHTTDGDLAAGAKWLHAKFPHAKIGILGFCMGGHIALRAAVDDRGTFSAVCPFYGSLDGIAPSDVRIPMCGSYGQRDTSIPADGVRAFAAALTVPHDVKEYPEAGHAFFDDQRAAYVATAAADAWKRSVAFLHAHLDPVR